MVTTTSLPDNVSPCNVSNSSKEDAESSPDVGSSRKMTLGKSRSCKAMHSLRFCSNKSNILKVTGPI